MLISGRILFISLHIELQENDDVKKYSDKTMIKVEKLIVIRTFDLKDKNV